MLAIHDPVSVQHDRHQAFWEKAQVVTGNVLPVTEFQLAIWAGAFGGLLHRRLTDDLCHACDLFTYSGLQNSIASNGFEVVEHTFFSAGGFARVIAKKKRD